MSFVGSDAAAQALGALETAFIDDCCSVACSVLVFYDHITTLPREVNLIWGRKLNSVTLLFYLNRWATFMWAVVQLAEFASLDTLSSCMGLDMLFYALTIVIFIVWAVFSAIRVYAISGGSWIWPMIVFTLSMVPVGTNLDNYFVTAWYGVIQVPGLGAECASGNSNSVATATKFTIGTRVCTIVADLLILIITWSKTYTTKRAADRSNVNTPITTMLLKDGTMYFLILLSLNVAAIVGYLTNSFLYTAELFTLPLSSIIVSHFFLNLRQAVHDIHEDPFVNSRPSFVRSEHSSLRFESFVGNMGEELVHGRDPPACDMTWPDNGSVEDDHDISLFRSQPMLMTHVASGNGFDNTNIEEMSTVGTAARAIHT